MIGFGSFLAYLGYGYLDTWHGVATLGLLPCFVLGLVRTFFLLPPPNGPQSLFRPAVRMSMATRFGVGRVCLLAAALGMVGGGATIMAVGMTSVFVPQDLAYMNLSAGDLVAYAHAACSRFSAPGAAPPHAASGRRCAYPEALVLQPRL
jgi:hypothetical protein